MTFAQTAITSVSPWPDPVPACLPSRVTPGASVTPAALTWSAPDPAPVQPGTLYLPPVSVGGLARMTPEATPPAGEPPVTRALSAGGQITGAYATSPTASAPTPISDPVVIATSPDRRK